ncbi:uncharacterized protein B0I36DRAFT_387561 [Microdochium trichocladiopsis]|uniref:Uncharacterized protein n=1 Tax=Microdochium trichocladiopsis TaxID=1682393 RepID=A0A9P8XZA5_9PEZI|nr:uncharacterized protein B0I36DRAFT_387561 [Microdochium trichocladiopsis]KAH7025280.1 hypothetical protein B0I36DRAFT_387561 [Microdochium trichocladiopsis]
MSESDNQVGFGFQADIVSTANLAHLLTGRILKALSDGGVDLYAITASIWLGKQIPFRTSLQATVHPHLAARRTSVVNSFLVKALSIGWGHTTVAVEMVRTQAGTNALLLIGALAAGVPSFHAAQCLSELLNSYGCAADQIPNVDVLKSMTAYIGPMVQDLGFAKVLEHVTTSASHELVRQKLEIPLDVTAIGAPQVLASAIKQLIFTSQRGETPYLVPRQRGACGGNEGKVVLQMAPDDKPSAAMTRSLRIGGLLLTPPTIKEERAPIAVEYLLPDALEAELGLLPGLELETRWLIHHAIVRFSTFMRSSGLQVKGKTATFGAMSRALELALQNLGIQHDIDSSDASLAGSLAAADPESAEAYLESAAEETACITRSSIS